VARQVSGEYQHFFTFRRLDAERVKLNVLTAAYLEPMQQDAMFMKAPTKPVVVYSHDMALERPQAAAAAEEAGKLPPPPPNSVLPVVR
jgi:hypothetical protein